MADIKTDTFTDYIKTRRLSRDTLIEDFVAAALMLIDTGTFPKVQTWDELHIHLQTRKASAAVIEGARRCWRNFETLRRSRRRSSRSNQPTFSGVSRKPLSEQAVDATD